MNTTVIPAGKPALLLLLGIALLVSGVSAQTIDSATVYIGNTTSVIDSAYLDINIWYFITAFGLLFIIISNRVKSIPENSLYAWMAIPFTLFSAYYSTRLQYTTTQVISDPTGALFNNTTYAGIHIQTVSTVYHPEVLGYLAGVVFLVALVNAIYITTKRPVEKTNPMESGKEE